MISHSDAHHPVPGILTARFSREKLLAALDAARLPHTDGADGAVIVHNVQIRVPYTRESVVSENQMAMRRTMDLLSRFFDE